MNFIQTFRQEIHQILAKERGRLAARPGRSGRVSQEISRGGFLPSPKPILDKRRKSRRNPGKKARVRFREMTRSLDRWERLVRILDWVRSEYFSRSELTMHHLSGFLRRLGRIWVLRGTKEAISWIKTRRSNFLMAMSRHATHPLRYSERRRCGRLVASALLNSVAPLGEDGSVHLREVSTLRLFLTVLTVMRAVTLPVELDVESIVSPSTANYQDWDSVCDRVGSFWRVLRQRLQVNPVRASWWKEFHITAKTGPEPKAHALRSACSDLFNLTEEQLEDIRFLGGPDIRRHMDILLKSRDALRGVVDVDPQVPSNAVPTRKVVGIPDMEGKTRAIAVLDYWSQTVLRPTHDLLFRYLKEIPQDVTFHQDSFQSKVQAWIDPVFYSVDLSKATDRFPLYVIQRVLEGLFSTEWATHWGRLLVGTPFSCEGGWISYSVGNPMGAYSSWSSFALAHHYVVYWCCEELGMPWGEAPYVLLGDDILIGDARLGEEYRRVITKLGVEVSAAKTYKSSGFAEFAKRLLFLGEEVTPFPVSSVYNAGGDSSLLVASMMGEEKKGLRALSGIPGAVGEYLHKLWFLPTGKPGPGRGRKTISASHWDRVKSVTVRDAGMTFSASRYLQGRLSASEFLSEMTGAWSRKLAKTNPGLAGRLALEIRDMEEEECEFLVLHSLTDCFINSLRDENGEALSGYYSEIISGLQARQEQLPHEWRSYLEAIPILGVGLGIERRLLDMESRLSSIFELEGSVRTDFVRSLSNPYLKSSLGLSSFEKKVKIGSRLGAAVRRSLLARFRGGWFPSEDPVSSFFDLVVTEGRDTGTTWWGALSRLSKSNPKILALIEEVSRSRQEEPEPQRLSDDESGSGESDSSQYLDAVALIEEVNRARQERMKAKLDPTESDDPGKV